MGYGRMENVSFSHPFARDFWPILSGNASNCHRIENSLKMLLNIVTMFVS